MKLKKLIKRVLFLVLFIALGYAIHYVWFAFPIISGYSAKNACSCAFIQGRQKETIASQELGSFPLSLGDITINTVDSSVTGSVLGLAKRKAIFRSGLGCTLVNEYTESTIRSQQFTVPKATTLIDTSAWISDSLSMNSSWSIINQSKLDSALHLAFQPRFQNKDVHTRAVVIVKDGRIIAEQYAPGFSANTPFLGWSMAKSVTSALIGILVKDGKLDVSQPAPIFNEKSARNKKQAITIEHLLQQTSGLDYIEDYSSYSHATNMLFNKGDMAAYVASLPSKIPPGLEFYYSSGNSNLLSGIIRHTVGEKTYHAFPYNRLFYKLGMHHTLLEPDASGTYVGSSYIYASARDYARFGYLYLNGGVWNGERILPDGWVQKTVTAPAANKSKNYGYQFWLNGSEGNDPTKREYPEAPADMFMADGYGGQRIYIIPSQKLVIVRMGLNKFDEHQFLKKVMEAIRIETLL
jgi:CubicO group peptidase (beta-lactamase class C family)